MSQAAVSGLPGLLAKFATRRPVGCGLGGHDWHEEWHRDIEAPRAVRREFDTCRRCGAVRYRQMRMEGNPCR